MSTEQTAHELIVQLGYPELGVAALLVALLQFLIALLLKARLQNSIRHEYDVRLEALRFEYRKREQAAKVAECLAAIFCKGDDIIRANQQIWELALWLPADLVPPLSGAIAKCEGAEDPVDILIAVRKLLHGADDRVTAEQIAHIPDRTT